MKAIKKKYLGLLLALFVLLVVGSTDTLASDKEKKITICHKTSSGTNPWVTIEIDESAWDSHEEHGDYKGPCRCNNSLEIYLVENEVDLGDFFPGSTHDLPAESGGNNQLEFVVTGSGNTGNKGHHADDDNMATYDFDYTMDLKCPMGNGYAEIIDWSWEESVESTSGRYGQRHRKRTGCFAGFRLYHGHGGGNEVAFAKFRFTAEKMLITSNATPGDVIFTVTVTVTVNI